jgi:uncharacterized protein (TIGR03435 family)
MKILPSPILPERALATIAGQAPPPADNAEALPDLYTAIQQQLELKLESAKAPVEVIAIDHVEKPSP